MYFEYSPSLSQVDSILDKEDVSLEQVLSDPSVLDECRGENGKLLTYLTESSIFDQLVNYCILEPDPTLCLSDRFKLTHVATELLASNVPKISYTLLRSTSTLDLLYSTLLNPNLIPLVASFLHRIIYSLMQYSMDEIYSFFAGKSDLGQLIIINMDRPAILHLIYQLLQYPSPKDMSTHLTDSGLIPELLDRLTVGHSPEVHNSAVQLLTGLLASCRLKVQSLSDPCFPKRDLLLERLESYETISTLISHLVQSLSWFPNKTPTNSNSLCPSDDQVHQDSLIICCLFYFRCLIDPTVRLEAAPSLPQNPPLDSSFNLWSDSIGNVLLDTLQPHIHLLVDKLVADAKCDQTVTYPKPIGTVRLHIVRFIYCLLLSKRGPVIQELFRLNAINILMDLFFNFPLNTFLHSTCESVLRFVVYCAIHDENPVTHTPPHSVRTSMSLSPLLGNRTGRHSILNLVSSSPSRDVAGSELGSFTRDLENFALNESVVESERNIFWRFLHDLVIEGTLLDRIQATWLTDLPAKLGCRGHLRLMTNILTVILGPGPPDLNDAESADQRSTHTEDRLASINPHCLNAIATNGCTNEFDANPKLCSFLRQDISTDSWNQWCAFVTSHVNNANQQSYVNYTEFPNSITTSVQTTIDDRTSADVAKLHALQHAYASFCSRPLAVPLLHKFGFPENEFCETTQDLNRLLDTRLCDVDFTIHLDEDTENSSLFEQACNEVIQLNGEEVGIESQCVPDEFCDSNTTSQISIEAIEITRCRHNSSCPSIPSKEQILNVFKNLYSNPTSPSDSDDEQSSGGCSTPPSSGLPMFRKSEGFTNLHEINDEDDRHLHTSASSSFIQRCQNSERLERLNLIAGDGHAVEAQEDERDTITELKPNTFDPLHSANSPIVSRTRGRHRSRRRPTPPVLPRLTPPPFVSIYADLHRSTNQTDKRSNVPSILNGFPEEQEIDSPILYQRSESTRNSSTSPHNTEAFPPINNELERIDDGITSLPSSISKSFNFSSDGWSSDNVSSDRGPISHIITPTKRSPSFPSRTNASLLPATPEYQYSQSPLNSDPPPTASSHRPNPSHGDAYPPYPFKTSQSGNMLASIKVRRASKTHKFPPFMISEDDFGPEERHFEDTIPLNPRAEAPTINGYNLQTPENATDMNSPHRFRSHRTINLRTGSGESLTDFI